MKQISSLDLYFLINEFKILENSRIESFFQEEDTFFIKIYVKGKGHFFLENKISKSIFISDKKEDSTNKQPKSFIQFLRKYLKNGFIQKIEQIANERILKIEISKKKEDSDEFKIYYLILELFSNGNILLVDENLEIKNSFIKKTYKDRTIRNKEIYTLPPQKELSIFNLEYNNLKESLKKSDLSIVKFLAINFGIGGKFAEEIIFNSNIDKNKKTTELEEKEINTIIQKCDELLKTQLNPVGILDENNKIIDFSPFKLNSLKKDFKEYKSFNEIIKTYFLSSNKKEDSNEKEFIKEMKKIENRIEKQKSQKEKILIDYEILNNTGNKIYENYSIINELLISMNKAAKEKGWDYVENQIKTQEKLSKIIKKLNYKNNEITIEI